MKVSEPSTPEHNKTPYKLIFFEKTRNLLKEEDRVPIPYDETNMLEKLRLQHVYVNDLNYKIIPDVIAYHRKELVPQGKLSRHKFSNNQLKVLCSTVLQSCIAFQIGNWRKNELLLQEISDKKKIGLDEFWYLFHISKEFVQTYNDQNKVIDVLISKKIGNKSILERFKEVLKNGYFLSEQETRYFQFCSLEFEKEKILDSGDVPLGWLPSDVESIIPMIQQLKEVQKRQGTTNKIMAFGLIANFWGDMSFRNN